MVRPLPRALPSVSLGACATTGATPQPGAASASPLLLNVNLRHYRRGISASPRLLKVEMSYYSPHAGAGYPYTSYPNYPQTPGAYPTTPYSTYPATGVTGYGAAWPYQAYSYYAHPQQQQQQQPAASTTAKPTATTSTFSVTPTVTTPAPPRAPPAQYTFAQTYTPSSTGLTATRSSKKQPTFKGLFAKERMCTSCRASYTEANWDRQCAT